VVSVFKVTLSRICIQPEETKSVIQGMLETHYRETLDLPVPALRRRQNARGPHSGGELVEVPRESDGEVQGSGGDL
jgi:hypothetical protein